MARIAGRFCRAIVIGSLLLVALMVVLVVDTLLLKALTGPIVELLGAMTGAVKALTP